MTNEPRPIDEARSSLMKRVRRSGTRPELAVRAALTELGVRYRLNVRGLPGSPDIANRSKGKAIFVHGCYWHRHPGCPKSTTPKHNREFWVAKFQANTERDRRKEAALVVEGFEVLTVWECETEDLASLKRRLHRFWFG